MEKFVIFFILFFSQLPSFSQNLEWIGQIGSSNNPNSSARINSIESNDSLIFISGFTSRIADLDPGASIYLGDTNTFKTPTVIGFVTSFDNSGEFKYSVRFNVTREFHMSIDDSSNLFVASVISDWPFISDPVDTVLCIVEHSAGIDSISNICTGQCGDFLQLLKFDQNGNLIYNAEIGNNAPHTYFQIYSLKNTRDNGSIIYGSFSGTIDFDPGNGINLSTGSGNFFLLKLDNNGDFVWFKKFPLGMRTLGLMDHLDDRIAIDNDNNIVIGGFFEDSIDTDPGPGVNYLFARGQYNAFLIKLDSIGNFIWSVNNGTLPQSGWGTIADNHAVNIDDEDNIIASGVFYGETDFDPGPDSAIHISEGQEDVYISKYTPNGELIWVNTYGGSGYDKPYDIDIDHQGSIYSTGVIYSDSLDFDPGINSVPFYSNSQGDAYIVKYTARGNLDWVHKIGSPLEREIGTSVKIHNSDLWIAGLFNDNINFNFIGGNPQILDPSLGRTYIAKYSDIISSINQVVIDQNFSLYPNPSNGKVYFKNSNSNKIVEITIHDLNGQIKYHQKMDQGKIKSMNLQINPGLYIAKILFDSEVTIAKKLLIR
ncbi:T9SS type A sorting domain-containing protein [Hyphobacterium sp. CCMP332]|nr:T9SS type A sorting domain-containing protein [Hyphobacterium sp. CCMP332]